MSWTVVPNFRALGPRLGKKVNEVKGALATADGSELRRQLDEQGWIEIAGERITADEVEVRAERHEAFALAEDQGWAVALDLELDDDLRAEGMARELVRALNDLRKEHGLDLSDRITLVLDADDALGRGRLGPPGLDHGRGAGHRADGGTHRRRRGHRHRRRPPRPRGAPAVDLVPF